MPHIRRTSAVAALGVAMILVPAAAFAGPSAEAEFTALDKNGDGFLMGLEFMVREPIQAPPGAPIWMEQGPDGLKMTGPDGKPLRHHLVPDGQTAVAAPGEVVLTYTQSRQALLMRYDADADGRLSLAEYRAARIRGAATVFRISDKNADQRLTVEEFVARLSASPPTVSLSAEARAAYEQSIKRMVEEDTARFKTLDVDADGFLTLGELTPV